MRWTRAGLWLIPVVLATVFWWLPPIGDDAYYHSVGAVEQVRAWHEGAVFPGYHRGWNGGTGSFAPAVYAPIPMAIQGVLAWLSGDGQRAVGLSLAMALLAAALLLRLTSHSPDSVLLVASPYFLAAAVTRATTTEAWALAGAAVILGLGMPGPAVTVRRGLGLAGGVALVAGSQVGMLLQLSWLLASGWLTWFLLSRRHRSTPVPRLFGVGLRSLAWASAGLLTSTVLWLPLILDGRNLALGELVTGELDWRQNFLPGSSELHLFLSLIAVCLGVIMCVVYLRGEGEDRLPQLAAAAVGLVLAVGLSAPVWRLPGMSALQFPWRFLGPATILVVMAAGSLSGRWRWLIVVLLVAPSAAVPLRLDTAAGHVPVGASPAELAQLVHGHWGLAPVLPSARGLYAPGFHRLGSLQELAAQGPVIVPERNTVLGGEWKVTAPASAPVLLPLQWWPGWAISVDDREVPFTNRFGLVAIEGRGGSSRVRAVLRPSRSRAFGGAMSLLGVLVLAGLGWLEGRREPAGTIP